MADELTISASYSLNTTNLSESNAPGSISIDVASVAGSGGIQNVGTAVEQITKGDTTDGGFYFFRNIDDTNFVEIGTTSDDTDSGTFQPFLKLLAGEYSIGRLKEANVFAKADTAAINLQYRMVSP
jgi:hypothetical protein